MDDTQHEDSRDPKFDGLIESNPEALLADGFEDAYVGHITPFGAEGAIAVYSRPKCIEVLMTRDGMAEDEAEEFFSFNTEGAYVGPFTPMFLQPVEENADVEMWRKRLLAAWEKWGTGKPLDPKTVEHLAREFAKPWWEIPVPVPHLGGEHDIETRLVL